MPASSMYSWDLCLRWVSSRLPVGSMGLASVPWASALAPFLCLVYSGVTAAHISGGGGASTRGGCL